MPWLLGSKNISRIPLSQPNQPFLPCQGHHNVSADRFERLASAPTSYPAQESSTMRFALNSHCALGGAPSCVVGGEGGVIRSLDAISLVCEVTDSLEAQCKRIPVVEIPSGISRPSVYPSQIDASRTSSCINCKFACLETETMAMLILFLTTASTLLALSLITTNLQTHPALE